MVLNAKLNEHVSAPLIPSSCQPKSRLRRIPAQTALKPDLEGYPGHAPAPSGPKLVEGPDNKVPIVAAVSIDEAGHPRYVKLATVATFSFAAIADWAQDSLAIGCEVISDGLACFRAVSEVGCFHQPVVVRGRHPKELSEFRWINTVLSNLKTSFSGTFHAFRFDKYANNYLGAFNNRFNRRFDLAAMTERVVHAICRCSARPEHLLRSAEFST